MKRIKAAAKISAKKRLSEMAGSAGSGKTPSAPPSTGQASPSRTPDQSPMPAMSMQGGAGAPTGQGMPMQVKRGGAVKKRMLGGGLMGRMQDKEDKHSPGGMGMGAPMQAKRGGAVKKRADGGAVKMTAGAGSGEGRLQKTAIQKRKG